jgi:hypothetical protein
MKKLIIIPIFILLFSQLGAVNAFDEIDYSSITDDQAVRIYKGYVSFLASFDHSEDMDQVVSSLNLKNIPFELFNLMIMDTALARKKLPNGSRCFFGGYESQIKNNLCMHPRRIKAKTGYKTCRGKNTFRCRPELFGKGLCVNTGGTYAGLTNTCLQQGTLNPSEVKKILNANKFKVLKTQILDFCDNVLPGYDACDALKQVTQEVVKEQEEDSPGFSKTNTGSGFSKTNTGSSFSKTNTGSDFSNRRRQGLPVQSQRQQPQVQRPEPSIANPISKKSAFLYVNGGYAQKANYTVQENDLVSFRDHLFLGRGAYLNHGGVNLPVVPIERNGAFKRDANGELAYEPTKLDYPAATMKNLKKTIDSIAKSNADEATLVYGDHGNTAGAAMWVSEKGDEGTLTRDILLEMNKEIPDETLIRRIHLHCFAGEMLGPKESVLNEKVSDISSMDSFLLGSYPSNDCALATAPKSDYGEYLSWPSYTKKDEDPWKTVLTKSQPKSLANIYKQLHNHEDVTKIPALSSQNFIDDMIKSACVLNKDLALEDILKPKLCLKQFIRVTESAVENLITQVGGIAQTPINGKLQVGFIENTCLLKYRELLQEKHKASANAGVEENVYNDYQKMKESAKLAYLKQTDPIRYEAVITAVKKRDKLLGEVLSSSDPTQKEKVKAKLEVFEKTDSDLTYLGHDLESVEAFKKGFKNSLKQLDRLIPEQAKKELAAYPHFASAIENADTSQCQGPLSSFSTLFCKGRRGYLSDALDGKVGEDLKRQRNKRLKSAQNQFYKKSESIANDLFYRPEYQKLKERYEKIKNCENSEIK